ncbi:MAG: NHLP bacteriocin export ABC transporter permease/ATPase subunit [Planctomycetes bacterium]|nr:NHLP bacteriocin export ABC transporter permease/ATPase subunit [Planctomycetota bacterium]
MSDSRDVSSSESAEVLHHVRGSTSLVLRDATKGWIVASGSVAVFGVNLDGGTPVGARRHLFSCAAGEGLFTGEESRDDSQGLMLVGLGDAVVREVSLPDWIRETPADFAAQLNAWASRLAEVLRSGSSSIHTDPYGAGLVRLEAGQGARSAVQELVWFRVISGAVSVPGAPGRELTAADQWLPLNDHFPLQALVASELEFTRFDHVHEFPLVSRGIQRLQSLCFHALSARQAAEDQREARRLQESRRLLAVDTTDAIRGLTRILAAEDTAPLRDTPLLTAVAALEPHLGFSFSACAPGATDAAQFSTIDMIASRSRVRMRTITLSAGWWLRDGGPLLGYRGEDRHPVALFRQTRWLGLLGWYMLFDPVEQQTMRVTPDIAASIASDAVTFIRPLPDRGTSSLSALVQFTLWRHWRDGLLLVLVAALAAILGMLQPIATQHLIDQAIPEGDRRSLADMAVALMVMAVGGTALSLSQGLISLRLTTLASTGLQTAVFDRLLRLPQSFFRRFSTGDLANRAMMVTEIGSQLNGAALTALLSGLMSLVNLWLCYQYSPQLAWIAVLAAFLSAVFATGFSLSIRQKALRLGRLTGVQDGLSVQLVSGISKLRVSGAEQRAFNFWSRRYSEQLELTDDVQRMTNMSTLLNQAVQSVAVAFLFFQAAGSLSSGISATSVGVSAALTMGTFLAFFSAFHSVIHGVVGFTGKLVDIMDSWAKRDMITPLLEAEPENLEGSINPGTLAGHVQLDRVVFRYQPEAPLILNGVSLEIRPGEFAAIVGPSGCGKSTIFRLLLGFDTPESGKIYFDDQDLATLDKTAVRRQLGVVMQSGRINAGSIFDAIAIGGRVTLEQAWEAARDAGFEADLKAMPMGMHTVVPEGASTLSGGQRQRLLIARALVRNPRVLMFDEATSALDNQTQEIVSASLRRRRVTRIVIAHRLSTIRDADRIFVLEGGTVRQSGTFDDLMEEEGLFRRLASRQMI